MSESILQEWEEMKTLGRIKQRLLYADEKLKMEGQFMSDLAWLVERVEKFHTDVSMIRRATDDMPKLRDINRMAREALAEADKILETTNKGEP